MPSCFISSNDPIFGAIVIAKRWKNELEDRKVNRCADLNWFTICVTIELMGTEIAS